MKSQGWRSKFFGSEEKGLISATKNRLLQLLARSLPGARTIRVRLHRWRGVKLGQGVWIGYDAILETSFPWLISIGDNAEIGIGVIIIGHFKETDIHDVSVKIEEDVFIGPGAIILQNVTIGRGAVVTAGSVVTRSVPPMTLVQGNPARPVAQCGVPLTGDISLREFSQNLLPLDKNM